jgi:hypothetical protein
MSGVLFLAGAGIFLCQCPDPLWGHIAFYSLGIGTLSLGEK